MNNINKNHRKNNKKLNTAHYLISRFLTSIHSDKFKLCGNAQSLLRYLGDLMDANLQKNGYRECAIPITTLCKKAGMTDKPAARHIEYMIGLKLLKIKKKLEKNVAVYQLGEIFSVWENLRNCNEVSIGDLAISFGDLANSYGETPELYKEYNTKHNTNNNPDETSKAEKQSYKQSKVSPLLEEWCSTKID